ncbi:hypothetical protein [Aquifex sp.]
MKTKTYEELGKSSLALSVAWFVFGIIQPIFADRFSFSSAFIAALGFLTFGILGVILLERSER